MQTIREATTAYEAALAAQMPLNAEDLRYKHERMADAVDPFPFFRGTYYRWVQHWATASVDWAQAPRTVSVGDLHIENFGTWRDAEARLCWGVNDFDEAEELPYTHDLIRLAGSARTAKIVALAGMKPGAVCDAILDGYRLTIASGGDPFVLEEQHTALRTLAMAEERNPTKFWPKLTKLLTDAPANLPGEVRDLLVGSLPPDAKGIEFRNRPQVGMGSLGRPRYVALCQYRGGWIAREAKAAATLADGKPNSAADAVRNAVRSPDPHYRPGAKWVVRRLGPRYSRIELAQLNRADLPVHFQAMGAETANVHLGTAGIAAAILADLKGRPSDWLRDASKSMATAIEADWDEWKRKR